MIGVGDKVGSYQILSLLGEGGMGVVYVAEHVTIKRRVALKVLRPEFSARQDTLQRFINEAVAVNKIGHEHIVEVTDFGNGPSGESFFVMECLIGESLGDRLKREGRWPLDRALRVIIQVAEALIASHSHHIIHRDLKPDNIFLIKRGSNSDYVKLLDFGIAKLVGEEVPESHNITRTGAMVGTPLYMSPEQCRAEPDIDDRTDIYSLAVVLYRIVTGEVPFTARNWTEIVFAHLHTAFPSCRALRPDLPVEFESVLNRAVTKSRDDRWPDMGSFRDALAAIELREGDKRIAPNLDELIANAPAPLSGGATAASDTQSTLSQVSGQVSNIPMNKEKSSGKRGVIGVVAGVVLVVAVITAMALRPTQNATVTPSQPAAEGAPPAREPEPVVPAELPAAVVTPSGGSPLAPPMPPLPPREAAVVDGGSAAAEPATTVEPPPPAPAPRTVAPRKGVASARPAKREPAAARTSEKPKVNPTVKKEGVLEW